ncbi:MAG TPA: hypothetical protein VMU45_12755 [Candidatus Eisenbacteria bacterium]|jgi:probable HAF family extracellular repeat protein|nr:hypothetical protein [Candidatus Eisenbacteria bacterium]
MTFPRSLALTLIVLLGVPLLYAPLIRAQSAPAIRDANLTFTTIDVPGAGVTNVLGINTAGDMVGDYGADSSSPARGFLLRDGNFTLFDYPGGNDTVPVGINDSGVISGSSFVRNYTGIVSFLYNGNTFKTIRAPGKTVTLANGINNAGIIVGGYGSLAATKGFVRIGSSFKTILPPGEYINVFGNGINNFQQVVGAGDDTGFFYSHGQFKTIAVPGASITKPLGINDTRIIVGWYSAVTCVCGFSFMNGKYIKVSYPGAMYTFALGINDSGQIVGSYTLDQQTYHGFVTSPITAADFE